MHEYHNTSYNMFEMKLKIDLRLSLMFSGSCLVLIIKEINWDGGAEFVKNIVLLQEMEDWFDKRIWIIYRFVRVILAQKSCYFFLCHSNFIGCPRKDEHVSLCLAYLFGPGLLPSESWPIVIGLNHNGPALFCLIGQIIMFVQ